ncbi:MAG: Bax inhibitor-1/YccA family protein [Mariprofundaceae bacterium]
MNASQITAPSAQLADSRIDFLGKTYGMLALCIAAGSAGAYFSMGASFPAEHPWMMLGLMIGGIFAVQAVRHISGLNFAALLGFGAITGLAISPLVGFVAAKSEMLVAQAFLTTAAAFVGLTAYVFISRKDFSFLKGFVWTGLIAMVVLGLSNYFFFESSTLQLAMSGMGVLLFSAFILYDTSNILRDYPSNEYIAAALTLYLDVFLLFQNLLVMFGMLNSDD